MPTVACPGCGINTYSMRVRLLRAECLVCGARLLSPAAAVPAALLRPTGKRPRKEARPKP